MNPSVIIRLLRLARCMAALCVMAAPGNSALLTAQIRPAAAVWYSAASTVVTASQSGLHEYTWPQLQPLRQLECSIEHILDLQLAADQQRLLVTGGTPGETGILQLLDLHSGKTLLTCKPHSDRITQTCWLPGEQQILTASDDGTSTVLDATDGTVQRRISLHSRPLLALTFSSSLPAATAGMDGIIRLWQPQDGQLIRTLDNHTGPVTSLLAHQTAAATTPMLYSASRDKTIRLWQPLRGRLVRFARLNAVPQTLLLTQSGNLLLAGCSDGTLLQLRPESMELLRTEQLGRGAINAMLQHPVSGDLLICADQGLLQVSADQLLP